ncbi:caspase, EACC1-associated type [Nocardia rhamnosiphila]|uniref:caspase, EACC1-associated type n=1 Tax=Nocardia rhamnosiphila TaxID=426716 RepID=UPI000690A4DA|nr:tetratricopeptide repeat protein [Nocardia rhamnosiphila]
MTAAPDRSGSRALLIGVAHYTHPDIPDIPAATTNLTDLRRVLTAEKGGGFATEHCTLLTDPDHSTQIGAAISTAAHEAGEVLLVYFTGHGLLDRRGRLHLALSSSDPAFSQVGWTSVPFTMLREEILDSPARARILILDCCFSGRAFEAMSGDAGLVAGQTEIRGTYTIVSSAANETSYAPAGHRNTAFTAALLAAAGTPGLALDELYRETDRRLHRDGHPRPRRRSIDIAGDLRLFGIAADEQQHRTDAESGDSDLAHRLGSGQEHQGGTEDAESRYGRAAVDGDSDAMRDLADLLYERGASTEAESWYRRAAEAGHSDAMRNLGFQLYGRGELAEAESWYRRAAAAGDSAAMRNVGILLAERDESAEAEVWYQKAINAGDTLAMYNFGVLLGERGELAEAENWYRRAADAGNTNAMFNLGNRLSERGRLVDAEFWYLRAAATGHAEAMNNLGVLLAGRGEIVAAESWYRRAADAGSTRAMSNLDHLPDERDAFPRD